MKDKIYELLRMINPRVAVFVIGALAVLFVLNWLLIIMGMHKLMGRLLIMLAVLATVAGLVLWRRWRMEHYGANLTRSLQAQGDDVGRQLEIAVLRERMNEAIKSLKTSGLGMKYRGNAALYALPWYIIIGPSAAGKSTLLRNSNLNFPYEHGEDVTVKGFGGTRNCDWWFSDEAILLDTAGRYTTEDDDHDEWITFLNMLKGYRRKMPINGVMLAISLSDILTCDEKGLQWHVKIVRNRVEELTKHLHYQLPIYLIFTKTDLINGFETFFSDSSDEEREQVWGMSELTKVGPERLDEIIIESFDQLYARLSAQRLRKLAIERDPERKQKIFDFPDQFAAALSRLRTFVGDIRKDNPYQNGVNIYGLYFTSGEQQKDAEQRITLGDNKRFEFKKEKQKALVQVSQGYFIKDLFRKVIFQQPDIAIPSKRRRAIKRLWQGSSIAVCLAVFIGAACAFSLSLHKNTSILNQGVVAVDNLVDAVEPRNSKLNNHLSGLLSTYDYYGALIQNKDSLPWSSRLGLYRGNDLLNPLGSTMAIVMQHDFMPVTTRRLEKQLREDAKRWPYAVGDARKKLYNHYYSSLKAYLMLCYPARINAAYASNALEKFWKKALMSDAKIKSQLGSWQGSDLSGLINVYLQQLKQQKIRVGQLQFRAATPDIGLINKARRQLYANIDADTLFDEVKMRAQSQYQPVTISDLLNGSGLFVSQTGLPGMYTKQAWSNGVEQDVNTIMQEARAGDWVISGELSSLNTSRIKYLSNAQALTGKEFGQLKQQVYARYFSAYNQAWLRFLSGVSVRPFNSLADAVRSMKQLEKYDGPMTRLLNVIVKNTHLSSVNTAMPVQTAVQSLLAGDFKQGASLKGYFKIIGQVNIELKNLSMSPDLEKSAELSAKQLLDGKGQNTALYKSSIEASEVLTNIADPVVAKALSSILLSPTREAWRALVNQAVQGVEKQWQVQVIPAYQQTVANKFPFVRHGDDASLNSVSRFLSPQQGALWKFVNKSLVPYLQLDDNTWKPNTWLGVGASFSQDFLNALTQAQDLSQALFAQSSSNPGFDLEIYPYPIPGVRDISLNTSGERYRYYNGPQVWHSIKWSAMNFNQNTHLNLVMENGEVLSSNEYTGIWGLFHLLSAAQLTPVTDGTYRAEWRFTTVDKKHVVVKLMLRSQDEYSGIGILLRPMRLTNNLLTEQ